MTYSFGTGKEVLFCLERRSRVSLRLRARRPFAAGRRQVPRRLLPTSSAAGPRTGPSDDSLWTLATLRRGSRDRPAARSDLGVVHLLGQSWGTWLGTEYALTYPRGLQDADPRRRLRRTSRTWSTSWSGFAPRSVRDRGDDAAPRGRRHASTIPNTRGRSRSSTTAHVRRLQVWPDAVNASLDDWNMAPYRAIQGPNEFLYAGSIKAGTGCPTFTASPSRRWCSAASMTS